MKLLDENQGIEIQLSVKSQLGKLIQHYFQKFPHLSLNQLSQKAEVSFTSLRRLLASSEKEGELAPHFVLNLCSYLYKEQNISKIIVQSHGPLKLFLIKHFSRYTDSEKPLHPRISSQWSWITLRSDYILFVYLVGRPGGLCWKSLKDSWKQKFQEIFKLCLDNQWVKCGHHQDYIFWIGPELEELSKWITTCEAERIRFYSEHAKLEEKSPLLTAEVGWDTFEKISLVLDRAKLDCLTSNNNCNFLYQK